MNLNKEYKIESDESNLKLIKVKAVEKEGSKNKFSETVIGYYGNINHLHESLLEKEIRDNIGDYTKFYQRTEELKDFINSNK